MAHDPVDIMAVAAILRRTRRRRKYFFATVLGYIPALVIIHHFLPTHKAMGTLFGTWVVLLVVVTFLVALCKCPRCGNYFHMHGITLLVLRRCLHCQFHIKDDTIITPES